MSIFWHFTWIFIATGIPLILYWKEQQLLNTQDGKLPWHPAFSAALHIEFEDDLEHLHFHEEYPLGTQPMRMDILIIKKDPDVHIRKNIGQIFRTYNVIEYKPPGVSLSINHFYKAYGYACFFQSDLLFRGNIFQSAIAGYQPIIIPAKLLAVTSSE